MNLADDRLIEIGADGKVTWQWTASDHIDDFHFDKDAREAIASWQPNSGARDGAGFDWFHMNSAAYIGPNKWFEEGDKPFDPKNVIVSSRCGERSQLQLLSRRSAFELQPRPSFCG